MGSAGFQSVIWSSSVTVVIQSPCNEKSKLEGNEFGNDTVLSCAWVVAFHKASVPALSIEARIVPSGEYCRA